MVPGDKDGVTLFDVSATPSVKRNSNTAPTDGLTVRNGMLLNTNGYRLEVNDSVAQQGATSISESGTLVTVEPHNNGAQEIAFLADSLNIFTTATLSVNGARVDVLDRLTTQSESVIEGHGEINILGGGTSDFIHRGIIRVKRPSGQNSGTLTLKMPPMVRLPSSSRAWSMWTTRTTPGAYHS